MGSKVIFCIFYILRKHSLCYKDIILNIQVCNILRLYGLEIFIPINYVQMKNVVKTCAETIYTNYYDSLFMTCSIIILTALG